jgi:hypothetical protein
MKTKNITTKKKEFGCVEMMHKAAQAVQAVTDPMTFEEKVAYWKQQSREFRKEMSARRKIRKSSAKPVGKYRI